ncbi:CAAX prenyl protease 1 homolog isoform X2 [Gouania willdenowi]|nr:CAAX prenyl protease 1 homolog isoform X2 [Gouania willdenowi]
MPKEFNNIMDAETFKKCQHYQQDKINFSLCSTLYSAIEEMLILVLGGIPFLWGVVGSLTAVFGFGPEYEILHSLLFLNFLTTFTTLTRLSWRLYETFVIKQRHGINHQTLAIFLREALKKYILNQCLLLPVALLLHIIKIGGDNFFIYAWFLLFIVSLVYLSLYTAYNYYIAPFVGNSPSLPDGDLKKDIEAMAKSVDFPLSDSFTVKGKWNCVASARCSFLSETLPQVEGQRYNDSEILAGMGHELGHWKLYHTLTDFVINQTSSFLRFFFFSRMIGCRELFSAFGFTKTQPTVIGLFIIFQFIFAPFNELLSFFRTVLSRRFEFQADAIAREMGKESGLHTALVKHNNYKLDFLVDDWLYCMYHRSHPPLLERLRALANAKQD